MPTYDFTCNVCGSTFEKVLRISEYDTPQTCPKCGSENTTRRVSCTNFVLVGDSWPSKNARVKSQMKKRRKCAGKRMADHAAPQELLVPNVNGERTESWADAQKLAASKGKDASGYDPLVQKEKRGET